MKRDIFGILVIKMFAIGLSFLGMAALANTMAVEDFGYFAMLFSMGMFISIPSMMGLNFSLLKHSSSTEIPISTRISLAGSAIKKLGVTHISMLLIAIPITVSVSSFDYWRFNDAALLSAIAFGFAYGLSEVVQSVTRVFDGAINSFVYREIAWRLSFLILAAINFLTTRSASPTLIILALTAALVITTAIQIYKSEINHKSAEGPKISMNFESAKVFKEAPYFMLVGVFSTATQHIIVVLVGVSLTVEATAHFFTSFKVMQLLSLSVLAVNYVLTPQLRAVRKKNNGKRDATEISKICTASAWINVLFCISGVILFSQLSGFVLGLFGEDYAHDHTILLILCGAAIANAATGPSGFVLIMFEQQKLFIIISAVSTATGIILCLTLSQAYGLIGFCIGYVGWTIIQNTLTAIASWKLLNINATCLARPDFGALKK